VKKFNPLVTAIITTHNRANVLTRAINSVLTQSYDSLEIIVVDDGSSDDTREVMASFVSNHPHIIYLCNDEPQGACQARNWGIRVARGEFVTGLDDDDEWVPERISIFVNNYDPNYSIIGAKDTYINKNQAYTFPRKAIVSLQDMLYENSFGNQAFVRRDRISEVGGFDEDLVAAQDYDMWLRLIYKFGNAKIIQQPLQNVYMDHDGGRISITSSSKKFSGYLAFYRKHRDLMNVNQRKFQLFSLYRARKKTLSLKILLKLLVPISFRNMVWYYLMMSPAKRFLRPYYKKFLSMFNSLGQS
jgi:glycosyltransferase involved in cell wall biosynthesis